MLTDERIPILLEIPAAQRIVSVEPMLEPVHLELAGIDWLACGPETGPGARYCDPAWIQDLADQCAAAGVRFFDKRKTDWLRREFPA